jgi:hypothetical protein
VARDQASRALSYALALPFAAALVAACGATEAPATAIVRDSAGIRIVESPGPAWTDGSGWRLAATPSASIGVIDGPEAYQFSTVRDAVFLEDGSILAANAQHPPEIRVFGPDGAHLRSMGGAGSGPGEFTTIWWVQQAGDTVVVYDVAAHRLTAFGRDGELIATIPVRLPPSDDRSVMPYVPWSRLSDGSLLIIPNRFVPEDAVGSGRASMPLIRSLVDGSVVDTVGLFPGVEFQRASRGHAQPILFGLSWSFRAHGDQIFVGAGDRLQVDVHDLHGRHLRSMRAALDRRPVTEAAVDALLESRLAAARSEADRQRLRVEARETAMAQLMPAHGTRILVGPDGHVWVEAYHAPGDSGRAWHVFDPDGPYLGQVQVPAKLRLTDIRGDAVLGVWTDDLGVASVRAYPLDRG